ncbi:hypothetical protein UFOVP422_23 [uncultured Caudovirales phage]|uniref:Uncharacterized protein n=1 Tax=uncultured Caudovirales phage TaxID=2100421 RepID=A0A6J5MDN5_9CAUD|nr:hypothetical protein UFOVP422_23 [uncultured Caudovirales phage]
MTCSELIQHLELIRRQIGDVDVRVDSDLFSDHATRDVTSVGILDYFVRDVQAIVLGSFPGEGANVTRVVLYVGNEPKYKVVN